MYDECEYSKLTFIKIPLSIIFNLVIPLLNVFFVNSFLESFSYLTI